MRDKVVIFFRLLYRLLYSLRMLAQKGQKHDAHYKNPSRNAKIEVETLKLKLKHQNRSRIYKNRSRNM